MLGSVLIIGGNKTVRLKKAWDILAKHGFTADSASPDLLVVKKESEKKSIGIAQAREIKNFYKERPFEKKVKAVVVEDAQLLTDDAQGSLLKILEEPPAFAAIFLLCDKEGSLMPTVVSRCTKIVMDAGKIASQALTTYDLASLSYEELFDLAKELSTKDKDEISEFLEAVLHFDVYQNPALVVRMEEALKELKKANVAVKFALEYLFLLHKIRLRTPAPA